MGNVEDLADFIRGSAKILVVTGAGISTRSGIPDFRGPKGIWKHRKPVYFDEFLASERKRIEYWEYKAEGHEHFAGAGPNAAHRALVELERRGSIRAVVTQNIDGLHQAAGSAEELVIELHGTNRWVECLAPGCRRRAEPGPAVAAFRATGVPPLCPCGGLLKFATISFGQALDPTVLAEATRAAGEADLVVALGSTLSVHPAASIPLMALERGVPYVIVNLGATDHDQLATIKIEADVAEILPAAVAALASAP
jgi:NAD-dependent deacetylase